MNDSIYAPPKTDLSKASDRNLADSNGDDMFYIVSLAKFTTLFFCTLGIYQIFWFFKNWSNYKNVCKFNDSEDRNIWPVPRAIFAVFFVHSLFREVDAHANAKSRPLTWSVDSSATLMVVLLIASGICSRLSNKGFGSPFTDFGWILLLVPLYFCFRQAQVAINTACGDPKGVSNSRFTVANWIWIVIGAVFWLLVIAGLVLPQPAA
jgi:hypothetical protein